jgi:tetratricopeptide (TPR) repeat protein
MNMNQTTRLHIFFCAAMSCILWLSSVTCAGADEKSERWTTSYALEANGKYEQAAAVLAPELDHGDSSEFALLRYGWLNYLQGNYNDAIRSYKRALERNQRSFDARLGIALPLMAQKRWREAARYLAYILARSPYDYTAHIRLMVCEEGLRKWETLEKHAREISAYYPSDATVLVYLARAYAWRGKNSQARAAYKRVLVRVPEHLEATRFLKQ